MKCKLCCSTKKNWSGSPRKCAFVSGVFSGDNYVCETMRDIKFLLMDHHQDLDVANLQYCNDDWYATVNVDDIDFENDRPLCFWLSWYKNRGRTQSALLLFDDGSSRAPTESEVLLITEYVKKKIANAK